MRFPQILIAIGLFLHLGLAGAETAATVVFATGSPSATGSDGVSRPLARGGELASGDTIDTSDGRVQLRFRDGASMSLQPSTRFRVDDYRFAAADGQAAADSRSFFSLLKGGLRTISGLIGKRDREQYRLGTQVAVIGIRGTEYGASLADDGLRVSTFAGLVEVCNSAGCQLVRPGETALAEHPERKPRLLTGASALPASAEVLPQMPAPAAQQELPAGGRASPAPAASPPTGASTYMPPANTISAPTGR